MNMDVITGVEVEAKKADGVRKSGRFQVIFTMDEGIMENRLLIVDEKINAVKRNIQVMQDQVILLEQERAQIELALGKPAQTIRGVRQQAEIEAMQQAALTAQTQVPKKTNPPK
ncbi:hypothetical protein FDZ73_20780 [bacterium]|nr:MAG: hypothetical protein FDZ73_20780 [bacterium]